MVGDNVLRAAGHACDMVNVVRDGLDVRTVWVCRHECGKKVDLSYVQKPLSASISVNRATLLVCVTCVRAYHHDPIALPRASPDMPEHIVRHVPCDIAQRTGRGVAPYHGRTRYVKRSTRGIVRRV